jgi:hypothetical protein
LSGERDCHAGGLVLFVTTAPGACVGYPMDSIPINRASFLADQNPCSLVSVYSKDCSCIHGYQGTRMKIDCSVPACVQWRAPQGVKEEVSLRWSVTR